jgi:iron complex transport system ATP-binding protein
VAPDAISFDAVHVDRWGPDGGTVSALRGLSWRVRSGERWAVLGPNGSGKTTMLELASGYLQPTRGTVEVLGQRFGRVDVRRLREHVALVSSAVANRLFGGLSAVDLVVAGAHGELEPWWRPPSAEEHKRALSLLQRAGFGDIAERPFGVLSEGERKQVLLARALMAKAELLLLDEPAAGLDVGGRERLVDWLASLAADADLPAVVLVTHHVEQIPPAFTHVLLLREGRAVASGALGETLSSETLTETFRLDLALESFGERFSCRAVW